MFQFKGAFAHKGIRGSTYECLKLSRLSSPLTFHLVIETQRITSDGQCDITTLTRLKEHLLEGLEFLDRTVYRSFLVADIKLNDLFAVNCAAE